MRALMALIFALLAPAAAAGTGTVAPREAREGEFRYLVFETAGARPGDALPMIVGLHYSSARPEVMTEYFDDIGVPVRVVLPQGPHPRRAGYSWFPSDYATMRAPDQAQATFRIEEQLSAFVASAATKHPTRGKPIVMGISYGGDLSFLMALRHPGQFRAAFPIAARFLPEWMPADNPCKPACPPIRAMHGERDTTVPMGPTQDAARELKRQGFDVQLVAYPDVAHDFDARMEHDFVRQVEGLLGKSRTSTL